MAKAKNEAENQRKAERRRASKETQIAVNLVLDGSGQNSIDTGYGMLNHILDLIAFWADMDLTVKCKGDWHIDAHHTVEDTGLVIGAAFRDALSDRIGIERVGFGRVPMDEALAEVSIDISGRPWLEWRGGELLPPVIAKEEKDLWREFYKAFASSARINIHVSFLYGQNGHHLLESAAKGTGMAIRQAIKRHGDTIRSTKGGLDR